MADGSVAQLQGLPPNVATVLDGFVGAARTACGENLVSVVLFGSAADNRLTAASDVNLILVLRSFDAAGVRQLTDTLLAAEAAIKLRVMFLLESEIEQAVELFAQKFADVLRRHRTIYGKELFATVEVPRNAEIFRLRQILLNLTLRLRESFATRGHRSEQVLRILSDALGPLRAAAATLLELESAQPIEPNAALAAVAASFGPSHGRTVTALVAAHGAKPVEGDPLQTLLDAIDLVQRISERASRLS